MFIYLALIIKIEKKNDFLKFPFNFKADKKARCSLAAQIILSNMKKQNDQQKIKNYERIRRPISPIRTEPGFTYQQNIRSKQYISSPTKNLPIHSNQNIELQDYQQPMINTPMNCKCTIRLIQ